MPVFKVWNGRKTVKKGVVGSTVNEVLTKGAEKLGYGEALTCSLVLEEDGTDIEDDDVLLEFSGKVLLLLRPGESWSKEDGVEENASENDQNNNHTPVKEYDQPVKRCSATNSPVTHSSDTDHPIPRSPLRLKSQNSNAYTISREISSAPLPHFSPIVMRHLKEGTPEVIWNKLISETSDYYYGQWPSIGDQQHYQMIGEKMFGAYPSIRMEGTKPWSMFLRNVSQRIRHIRHNLKTKSQQHTITSTTEGELPVRSNKKACFHVTSSHKASLPENVSPEDNERHMGELQKEWSKSADKRDAGHIKSLLKQTKAHRKELLIKHPDGRIKPLFDQFPCFEDAKYIMYDFCLMLGEEKVKEIAENMKKLVVAAEELMIDGHEEGPLRMLPIVRYLETQTKYDRTGGKLKHTQSIITLKMDLADEDIVKALESKSEEAPRLVLLCQSKVLTGMYIVGDGVHSQINKDGGVIDGVMKLLATYYIFDIDYPRQYAMFMAVLQTFVIGEPYGRETTQKYKFLHKKLRPVFDKVAF